MLFNNNEKNGYCCSDDVIIVLYDNSPFYYFENYDNNVVNFNLPPLPKQFSTENDIKRLKKPIQHIYPPLPKRQKFKSINENFSIEVRPNPNKASVNVASARIILDNAFLDEPLPFQIFVLGHEISHNLYYDECACDIYSAYMMIEKGYNPSQCLYSNYFCLSNSDKTKQRKIDYFNWLKQINIK
jgi:hypothetical protein